MANYRHLAGTTDVSVEVFIFDPATGLPDNTVIFSTAGLVLQYRREGQANVTITEVTLAALTTAHTDFGFLLIGNGVYRLDLPDAAVAAGARGVTVHGTLTNRVVIGSYVELVAYNPFDAVRLGLTALPNVASGSAGAIPTTGTGANQISLTTGLVSTDMEQALPPTPTADTRGAALKNASVGIPQSAPGAAGGLALFDNVLNVLETHTVASVTNGGQFILSAGASSSDVKYEGMFLGFNDGPAAPQFRFINIGQYNGTTKEILFPGTGSFAHRPFSPAPEAGNTCYIFGLGGVIPTS